MFLSTSRRLQYSSPPTCWWSSLTSDSAPKIISYIFSGTFPSPVLDSSIAVFAKKSHSSLVSHFSPLFQLLLSHVPTQQPEQVCLSYYSQQNWKIRPSPLDYLHILFFLSSGRGKDIFTCAFVHCRSIQMLTHSRSTDIGSLMKFKCQYCSKAEKKVLLPEKPG